MSPARRPHRPILTALLVALAAQMVQPSHADRNKALYAVNSLLVDWPEDL